MLTHTIPDNGRHEYFMRFALEEAHATLEAGQFPVGCILVLDGQKIVARGGRRNSSGPSPNELDHAEILALRDLYTLHSELDRNRITVYSTMEPCLMCFSTLILNNINVIVFGFEDPMGGGTNLPLQKLAPLYRDRNPTIRGHVLREECIALFMRFFSDTRNQYWQNSLLAKYTFAAWAESGQCPPIE